MIKDAHLVKRSQALLGSNLARDSQMQIALNNAADGGGNRVVPISPMLERPYSSFFAHAFKTQ
jgi:hypothetical protein